MDIDHSLADGDDINYLKYTLVSKPTAAVPQPSATKSNPNTRPYVIGDAPLLSAPPLYFIPKYAHISINL